MSVFHRGGNYLHHRLTKLYSDTKQSYQSAAVASAPSESTVYDPDVDALRREYQVQQDRLLAWGLHWTDVNAAQAHSQNGAGELEIDKKLDQAGLGDIAADVMSEIQRLLNEAGNLQHPKKKAKTKSKSSSSLPGPHLDSKPWTWHEIADSKSLLTQLTSCIDVLYRLSESRRTFSHSSKLDKEGMKSQDSLSKSEMLPDLHRKSPSISTMQSDITPQHELSTPETSEVGNLKKHHLYIEYSALTLRSIPDSNASDPPPTYYEAMRERLIGTAMSNSGVLQPVLVEFISTAHDPEWTAQIFQSQRLERNLALLEKLSGLDRENPKTVHGHESSLSYSGHLRLLGYTLDENNKRFGLIYHSPSPEHGTEFVKTRTLASVLSAHLETSGSTPALEDRFRLAYNITISLASLMSEGTYHGDLNSTNIVLLESLPDSELDGQPNPSDTPRSYFKAKPTVQIRNPYLFAHAQIFPPSGYSKELLSSSMYRHPQEQHGFNLPHAQYEIYTLGLILLEIGLWVPISKFWKPKYNASLFKSKIKHQYVEKLASKCGRVYMNVVMKCLNTPEDLAADVDDRSIDLRLAERMLEVLENIAKCCRIDVDGAPTAPDLEYFHNVKNQLNTQIKTSGSSLNFPMTPESIPDENNDLGSRELATAKIPKEASAKSLSVLRKWPEIDIPQADLDEWNTNLMPRISKMLQSALQGSPESCSASLMMIGPTAEEAKTTICIQCTDVRKIRDTLQKGFKARTGWGVVVLKGEVRRSGKRRKTNRKAILGSSRKEKPEKTFQNSYQERPSCGASIGAFKNDEHLPPVSFGGTVLVDGNPFGMTVHHMLDVPSDDESSDNEDSAERSAARRNEMSEDLQFMMSSEDIPNLLSQLEISDDDDDDDGSDASTIRPDYAAFDEEGHEFWFLDDAPHATPELEMDSGSEGDDSNSEGEDEFEDEDDTQSVGDVVGVDPCDEEEFLVTQPAIDDVEDDFFPNIEDKAEDHLASHTLGYVHASSGIRRVTKDGIKHEVDWALIKIHDERLRVDNAIRKDIIKTKKVSKSGSKAKRPRQDQTTMSDQSQWTKNGFQNINSSSALEEHSSAQLSGVAPLHCLAGTEVYCCGRTSGFRKGRISRAMTLVKMHGRESFSNSWCVEGGFGVPGDSGAWIYNAESLELCGHVLAWGDKSKTAYIAPMEILFEDIKKTLGAADVCLPGTGKHEKPSAQRKRPDGGESRQQPRDSPPAPIPSDPTRVKPTTVINKELAASREVELALKDINLGYESLGTGLNKRLPPIPKSGIKNEELPVSCQMAA